MSIRPKKSLGQNFLRDKGVVKTLVRTAALTSNDVVLEPGAGTGIVTREIAKQAKLVYAVEFDRDLIPKLKKDITANNVEIFNQDVLKLDWQMLDPQPTVILGSIPYQITSPLVHKILRWTIGTVPPIPQPVGLKEETRRVFPRRSRIVLLIQKEVAQKICAQPPKATYLSNLVAAFGEAKIVRTVAPTAFWPRPKVQSAILRIEVKSAKFKIKSLEEFEKFLHQGFKHPRKMVNKVFSKDALEACGIDPKKRPGAILLEEWLTLFQTQASKARPSAKAGP